MDEETFQKSNVAAQDRRFYSCMANMVLLPTPLKAFADAMIEVEMMLRVCALHLYGWSCEHEDVADVAAKVATWTDWD